MSAPYRDRPSPPARVVETRGEQLRGAVLGAVFTMWMELGAAWLLGGELMRIDRGVALGVVDVGVCIVVGGAGVVLVRRIVWPRMLCVELRRGGAVSYRSTSWVHGLFDVLYLIAAASMLRRSKWEPGPAFDPALSLGAALCVVATGLLLLRIVFHRRATE